MGELQFSMLIKLLTMGLLHPHNDAMPVEVKILVFCKFSILLLLPKVDRYSTVFAVLQIFILNT